MLENGAADFATVLMPPVAAQLALDGVGFRDGQLAAVGGCAAEKDCRRVGGVTMKGGCVGRDEPLRWRSLREGLVTSRIHEHDEESRVAAVTCFRSAI